MRGGGGRRRGALTAIGNKQVICETSIHRDRNVYVYSTSIYIYLFIFYTSQWRRECLGDYHDALYGFSTVHIVNPTAYASRRRTEDIHALILQEFIRVRLERLRNFVNVIMEN